MNWCQDVLPHFSADARMKLRNDYARTALSSGTYTLAFRSSVIIAVRDNGGARCGISDHGVPWWWHRRSRSFDRYPDGAVERVLVDRIRDGKVLRLRLLRHWGARWIDSGRERGVAAASPGATDV